MFSRFPHYLQLLRPHQWVKNLLVFAPMFFGLKIGDGALLAKVILTFFCFCFTSGAIYIFNDWKDIESDRKHPEKRHRVLATGKVTPREALVTMAGMAALGLAGAFLVAPDVGWTISFYFVLNLAYTFKLKHLPIIDIAVIAAGFVLRLNAGAGATEIALSEWIIVITFLLALFLALAKRRDDVLIFLRSGDRMRRTVDGYNLEFLNAAMVTMAAVVIVSYILYTRSPEVMARVHSQPLYLTTFFVVIGILRYMQITFVEDNSGNPTKVLLKDRFLQLTIAAWLAMFAWLLYR